ncbi:MAG: hypothetical protein ACKV0T_20700 [Planctomycetales bacterium]
MSRMLASAVLAACFSGCIGVGPHDVYTFEEGNKVSTDVLDYNSLGRYLAIHAKGRPGWYVLKFDIPEGNFEQEFRTSEGALSAWYLPPIAPDRVNAPDEKSAPDLPMFAADPENAQFNGRVVRLEGLVSMKGKESVVNYLSLDLKSQDQPETNLKGKMRREKHFVRFEMPPMSPVE